MTCICYNSFVFACVLASLSWPAICSDEVASAERPTAASDSVPTTAQSHDEMEGSRGSRSPNFDKERLGDMDCTIFCSEHRSDESDYDEKERWHKSNRTWNATFEHEAAEGEWHRHNGTWNGTFEREGAEGKWEGSYNGTLNKSFDRENGEGKWHRNRNGTWSSHYEDADGKRHESNGTHDSNEDRVAHGTREGKAKCDCRQRSGVENELDAAGHAGTGRHHGGSDATRGGKSEADDIVHGGSDHDDGGDGFRSAALKDERTPQFEAPASSNNDQDNDGSGSGNAAVLGLAGAGIAALCVASCVLLICCRRNGKVPLTSGAALFGKSVDNAASSDPGVVAGVVVNNV